VLGEETAAVLDNLKIAFISYRQMYMGIRDEDGNIAVGTHHLRKSDLRTLYLDVVHELFHVKQHMEDSDYFHREHMKFMRDRRLYYVSPIEVPAYEHTVREAERIGLTREEIVEYLRMGEPPERTFRTFLKKMEIDAKAGAPGGGQKLPVRINRSPRISLYPLVDYFKGLDKAPAVRSLFGEKTETFVKSVMVEFVDSPFGSIFPSEDGHLVASIGYVKSGSLKSIYLDILLCLNLLKHLSEGDLSFDPEHGFGQNEVIVESYKAMVEEARRMKMTETEISEHLQLPRFLMSQAKYARFVHDLGLA